MLNEEKIMPEKNYRIIRLEAENIKGVKAVDITPPSGVVKITGGNGQGKSSVLDAIVMTLAGAKHVPDQPIRHGAEAGNVLIDCDDFTVQRIFTDVDNPKKTKLKIVSKNGSLSYAPQEFLNGMLGKLGFDPLEFARMRPGEQYDVLIGLVDIDIDMEAWKKERQRLYDERTEVNRSLKSMKNRLEGMVIPDPDLPEVEISTDAFLQEIQEINNTVLINTTKRNKLGNKVAESERLHDSIHEKMRELRELQMQIEKMECSHADLRHEIDDLQAEVEGLVDPVVDAVKAKMEQAQEINRKVRERDEFMKLMADVDAEHAETDALTNKLCDHDEKKLLALQKADFPVDGLTLWDSVEGTRYVAYNDTPFSQLAESEKLKISLSIAMAMNPELRVIQIKDGSLIDNGNMKLIEDLAAEKDYQVWIECVDETGETGIVIENGEVSVDNYKTGAGI